ncbi:hypothetical protein EV44_g1464 [Erysiphe necator]|uniref:Uncharacterized protein n=1 Tax=Uncinula necator TaxID=52586 RepID=A0A0B1PDR9_UNCNE|nr:hypothetical protein EV44_g1464 [Erysiphe necator]
MSEKEKIKQGISTTPSIAEGKPEKNEPDTSDSDDYFSDAHSGLDHITSNNSLFSAQSNHSEEHETTVQNLLEDEIAPNQNNNSTASGQESPKIPRKFSLPIPITIVEKIDPSSLSHGEVPGTEAHEVRAADAAPDLVIKVTSGHSRPWSNRARASSTPGDRPIPITKVERIDRRPSYGEIPGTLAYEARRKDAIPDIIEEVEDIPVSPTLPRSHSLNQIYKLPSNIAPFNDSITRTSIENLEIEFDAENGDDFDDFEGGEEDAEFGEFDNSFQQATPSKSLPSSIQKINRFPVLDFTIYDTPEEIQDALEPYLNVLFPTDTIDNSVLPPLSDDNSTFLTPRSASLWTQLIAPPSLQPPRWIQSRIRRLFLVSLGVPVDLDEILPASKQKKLILPSVNLNPMSKSPRNSSDSPLNSRLKRGDDSESCISLDSQGKPSRQDSQRNIQLKPAPPTLDLFSARQLCMTTNEALSGLTGEEMKLHLKRLKRIESRAKEVLIFWTERKKEKLGDRDAFEGVIENLVKHARKARV